MGVNGRARHRSLTIVPATPAHTPGVDVGADGTAAAPQLGPRRHYWGHNRTVSMPSVTSVRQAAAAGDVVAVPVTVMVDGAVVTGQVAVAHQGGMRYEVGESRDHPLVCDQDVGFCGHLEEAFESTRALLEARQIRTGLQGMARATDTSAGVLEAEHTASVAAQEQAAAAAAAGVGSSWADDPTAFQAAYVAARRRRARGEAPVPYMTEDATGGLGARNGGRPFGVEMEFNLDPSVNRAAALQAIANDLHAAGLLRQPRQADYHASSDYSQWRFETDPTVAGEIISPVMYDEPQRWAQLAQVCEIVRRHGGQATTGSTGGHVHIGVADYDHTVENHERLLATFHEHEDTMFRLAQNPDRRRHRGIGWCRPNMATAYGRRSRDVAGFAASHTSHNIAMNFQATGSGGEGSHVEYRMWDSSLDPGTIQAQVKMSLGMTQAAFASSQPPGPRTPLGTHRAANAAAGRGGRLRGEAWQRDTAGFRGLVDRVFHRDADKAQATALFAVTRWQQG